MRHAIRRFATRASGRNRRPPPPPSGGSRPPAVVPPQQTPNSQLVPRHEGPSRGFGVSMGLIGGAGILAACGAWVWSYRQWLEKNRPGSTRLGEAGLTALGDLSDLGQYVNCGELTKGSAMCAGCERPLNGSGPFRIAEGRLWHPEHVDCRGCIEQGAGPCSVGWEGEGSLWCTEHWLELQDAFNCSVCSNPLQQQHAHVLPTGAAVCTGCNSIDSRCFTCWDKLRGSTTSAECCSRCSSTSVWQIDQAEMLFGRVAEEIAADFGVDIGLGAIKLEIGDLSVGEKQYKQHGGLGQVCVEGLTKMKSFELQAATKRVSHKEVDGIYVLQGLPMIHTCQVLVHELMHAWLAKNKVHRLPHQLEEGLCELVSYLWLVEHTSKLRSSREAVPRIDRAAYGAAASGDELQLALARLRLVEMGYKPGVYSSGFQECITALQGRQLHQLLDHVKQHKQLPEPLYPSPLVCYTTKVDATSESAQAPDATQVQVVPDFRG